MEEYEVKYLDINPAAIEAKIYSLGGTKAFDRLFHRAVFDYPDLRLDQQAAWVRVRDEGDRVTMAFKQRLGYNAADSATNDDGMNEYEVVVSDFETACNILRNIGLTDKFFIENRRVQYKLDGTEIDVEYWPMLQPYLEIEGESWAEVESTISKLGLDPSESKRYSTTQIYAQKGINDKDYQILAMDYQVKKSNDAVS